MWMRGLSYAEPFPSPPLAAAADHRADPGDRLCPRLTACVMASRAHAPCPSVRACHRAHLRATKAAINGSAMGPGNGCMRFLPLPPARDSVPRPLQSSTPRRRCTSETCTLSRSRRMRCGISPTYADGRNPDRRSAHDNAAGSGNPDGNSTGAAHRFSLADDDDCGWTNKADVAQITA